MQLKASKQAFKEKEIWTEDARPCKITVQGS